VRSPPELVQAFRHLGFRMTPQRQRIFEVLDAAPGHPTVEQVYEVVVAEMPAISVKTVYHAVHELESLGEITLLDLGLGSFRIDKNVTGEPHHHLVCRRCGEVRDLVTAFEDLDLPPADAQGFVVGRPEIVFRGLCPACALPTTKKPTRSKDVRPQVQ
jgi:Fur family transcriptional regulator, stress-responsive regulator